MKKITILAAFLFITAFAFSQKENDYLVVVWDTIHYSECGYMDASGKMVIPMGRYPICMTDTFSNFAVVYKSNKGFIGINRAEKVLFTIFMYDNGPDFPSEGLFRITKNGKVGFANLEGKVVVEPKYSAVYPFSEGLSAFCKDCSTERMGEVSTWKGGKWGFMNKKGEVMIEPQFHAVNDGFKNGKIKVKIEDDVFEIDTEGKRIGG
ncbi:MAG: WG repeat-containing protein [Saprospiraceae bacterium]